MTIRQFDRVEGRKNESTASGSTESPRTGSPFLLLFFLLFTGYWGVTATTVAVDPLDLYDWGRSPTLLRDYNRHNLEYLAAAASRAPVDTLLIGGSPSATFTSARLERYLPETKRAFNFSMSGVRPLDRAIMTDLVLKNSPARHILLTFDWIYAMPAEQMRGGFPAYLYDNNWLNDLRVVSPTVLRLLLGVVRGQPLALENWDYLSQEELDDRKFERTQTEVNYERIKAAVIAQRDIIGLPSSKKCKDFSALNTQLLPFAQEISRQGRQLDVLIPPYSLAMYGVWENSPTRNELLDDRILSNLLEMRRCLVMGVEGLENVRVFAFDNETWMTGDLANFRDPAHLRNDEKLIEYILEAISAGRHVLTAENIGEYLAALRNNVLTHDPYNSRLGGHARH